MKIYEKPCEQCGKKFKSRPEEGPVYWEKKKYCGLPCSRDARRTLEISLETHYRDRKNRYITQSTKVGLLEMGYYRPCCEICGWHRIIELAHIIAAPMLWWNILTLCPNHHRLFDKGMLTDEERKGIKGKIEKAHELFEEFEQYVERV